MGGVAGVGVGVARVRRGCEEFIQKLRGRVPPTWG